MCGASSPSPGSLAWRPAKCPAGRLGTGGRQAGRPARRAPGPARAARREPVWGPGRPSREAWGGGSGTSPRLQSHLPTRAQRWLRVVCKPGGRQRREQAAPGLPVSRRCWGPPHCTAWTWVFHRGDPRSSRLPRKEGGTGPLGRFRQQSPGGDVGVTCCDSQGCVKMWGLRWNAAWGWLSQACSRGAGWGLRGPRGHLSPQPGAAPRTSPHRAKARARRGEARQPRNKKLLSGLEGLRDQRSQWCYCHLAGPRGTVTQPPPLLGSHPGAPEERPDVRGADPGRAGGPKGHWWEAGACSTAARRDLQAG